MARLARLDAELVRRSLARSREHATELIAAGRVSVSGHVATKPATSVDPAAPILVAQVDQGPSYASRGGHKLAAALEAFAPGLVVAGKRCLDAGASTGGFTDVLLRAGAREVHAVDVGYGQLVWALQQDARVVVHDRTNVRALTPDVLGGPVELATGDLSFISLRLVLPALLGCVLPGGDLVLLVKPQFEVGKERLGKGGVVRDPELHVSSVLGVAEEASRLGLGVAGLLASPLPGPAGNVEYLLWLRHAAPPAVEDEVRRVVATRPGGEAHAP